MLLFKISISFSIVFMKRDGCSTFYSSKGSLEGIDATSLSFALPQVSVISILFIRR